VAAAWAGRPGPAGGAVDRPPQGVEAGRVGHPAQGAQGEEGAMARGAAKAPGGPDGLGLQRP
jgi:hypothetical protein